jgi:hypothetical protein
VDQTLGNADEEFQSTGKREGAALQLKLAAGKMAAELTAEKRDALLLKPDSVAPGWACCRDMLRTLAAVAPDLFLPASAAPRAKPPSVLMRAAGWQPDAAFFEKLVRDGAAAAAADAGVGLDSSKPRPRGKSTATGARERARASLSDRDMIAEEGATPVG